MSWMLIARVVVAAFAVALAGCGTVERLSNVGEPPPQSRIINPLAYQPAVQMPMPQEVAIERPPNSLWRQGARAFLSDQRAARVGDLVTVTINIADAAKLENTTTRGRTNTETAQARALAGYETIWNRLPGQTGAVTPEGLIDASSASNSQGNGSVNRREDVSIRLAATITQILPNGNLVIAGSQEVRVNNENRVLQVAGVVRPQDIRSDNQIPYDRVAEARISYGGRGQITDVQQPRWGQQVFDAIWPF